MKVRGRKRAALLNFAVLIIVVVALCSASAQTSSQTKPAEPSEDVMHVYGASPCANALVQGAVCEVANKHALQLMTDRHLDAGIVMQDVRTGALLVFATSQHSGRRPVSVGKPVLPLSLSKLFLAASWWDRKQPESTFECRRSGADDQIQTLQMSVHEMLVSGCDLPARQMAAALRKSVGADAVIADFKRFGFKFQSTATKDFDFWAQLETKWRATLIPFTSTAGLR